MKLSVIGIPKWDWKKTLLKFAESHPNIKELDISQTCYECSRHMDILDRIDKGTDAKSSEYWQYYKKQNRSGKYIHGKINTFAKLYDSIKENGCKDPPVITDDGCRLNGSHRLAILIHLGINRSNINVANYEKAFGDKKAKKIRKQVAEYRKKVYNL